MTLNMHQHLIPCTLLKHLLIERKRMKMICAICFIAAHINTHKFYDIAHFQVGIPKVLVQNVKVQHISMCESVTEQAKRIKFMRMKTIFI